MYHLNVYFIYLSFKTSLINACKNEHEYLIKYDDMIKNTRKKVFNESEGISCVKLLHNINNVYKGNLFNFTIQNNQPEFNSFYRFY